MLNEPQAAAPAQQREHAEPSETNRPVPLLVAAFTLAVVLFGAGYILMSEPFGPARLGDRRTLADLSGPPAGAAVDGAKVYTANCVACHQATGQGLPGVFPPLAGSEWVVGDPRVLANILLHGLSGPIEVAGKTYNGSMPAFAQLGDAELAAVATHLRTSWSNSAEPLDAALFERERKALERSKPFNGAAELLQALGKAP